jgi:hypothetical protein
MTMTNKDALKILKIGQWQDGCEYINAVHVAITALERMDRIKMWTEKEIEIWLKRHGYYNTSCHYNEYKLFAKESGILIEPEEPKYFPVAGDRKN